MSMNEFLNRYVQGRPGEYYFQLEHEYLGSFSGGYFYRKQDARLALLARIICILDLLVPGAQK